MEIIAKKYASAFLQEALAGSFSLDEMSLDFSQLSQVFKDTKAIEFLQNPQILLEKKRDFLIAFLSPSSHKKLLERFLQLIVESKRIFFLPKIAQIFEELKNQHNNLILVEIASADPLDAFQREDISKQLALFFKASVECHYIEDKSLLGGYKVTTKDCVVDLSLKHKVMQITKISGVLEVQV